MQNGERPDKLIIYN